MNYTEDQIESLHAQLAQTARELDELQVSTVSQADTQPNEETKTFLKHGVGRRIGVIKAAAETIFEVFPPERESLLTRHELSVVQINLHAFVANLSGILDNWAWAFLYRHNVQEVLNNRHQVGMFKTSTQAHLPPQLKTYMCQELDTWHQTYLVSYRDALAHRIPLYVPPANWTDADENRYHELGGQITQLIAAQDWEGLDAAQCEQDHIGTPSCMYLHEFSTAAGNARAVYLHPQVVVDAMTIAEFGRRFYQSWHDHIQP